jgi:DNA modification methylase
MSDVLLVCADARKIPLPDNSVQCVVTSPPYWGLRKYAGDQVLEWDAAYSGWPHPVCKESEHDWETESKTIEIRTGAGLEELGERYSGGGHSAKEVAEPFVVCSGTCRRCGAWKGAFGLEPTVEMYIAHTLGILREIRRVLRSDGVVFWNIGDSYANDLKWGGATGGKHARGLHGDTGVGRTKRKTGLKPKDLVLMPERIALAAQDDGWWVRSRILWNKRNPMPESVVDRPTDAHEHIWMFTKRQDYFWDCEAVRENVTGTAHPRGNGVHPKAVKHGDGVKANDSFSAAVRDIVSSRHLRNVWSFATQPYSGAHFATFPEALPRTCIKAATSQHGACSRCGAPWERILEDPKQVTRVPAGWDRGPGNHRQYVGNYSGKHAETEKYQSGRRMLQNVKAARDAGMPHDVMFVGKITLGWKPTCGCGGVKPDDLEVILSPNGANSAEDDWEVTGRKGFNRPRVDGEGTRPITRYEQRAYAEQLRRSTHRATMELHAGKEAFEHYIRKDRSGARAIPPDLLASWVGLGWVSLVVPPDFSQWPTVRPCLVLDPFGGSGTTGQVAVSLNRSAVCLDLAYTHTYGELAKERTSEVQRELML